MAYFVLPYTTYTLPFLLSRCALSSRVALQYLLLPFLVLSCSSLLPLVFASHCLALSLLLLCPALSSLALPRVGLLYASLFARRNLVAHHIFGDGDQQLFAIDGGAPQAVADVLLVGENRTAFHVRVVSCRPLVRADRLCRRQQLLLAVGGLIAVV